MQSEHKAWLAGILGSLALLVTLASFLSVQNRHVTECMVNAGYTRSAVPGSQSVQWVRE